MAALVNLRLGHLTGDGTLLARGAATVDAFPRAARRPSAHTWLLAAVDLQTGPTYEVVVAGQAGDEDFERIVKALRRDHAPHRLLLHRPPGETPPIVELAPFTREQDPGDGPTVVYVCEDRTCRLPTSDLAEVLASSGPRPPADEGEASAEDAAKKAEPDGR